MPSPINESRLREQLAVAFQQERVQYRIIVTVADAIKPFDGKVMNKRIGDAVRLALPAYTVMYSQGTLQVWGGRDKNSLEFFSRISINFAVNPDTNRFCYHRTAERMTGYFAAQKRAEQLWATLENLPTLVARYNAALATLEVAYEAFGHAGVHINRRL